MAKVVATKDPENPTTVILNKWPRGKEKTERLQREVTALRGGDIPDPDREEEALDVDEVGPGTLPEGGVGMPPR